MTGRYDIPFGRGTLAVQPPPGWVVDVADGAALEPGGLAAPVAPVGAFAALARRAQQVVVVFTDATRQSPDQALAERALVDLQATGFPLERVSFLCATGAHRPSTLQEKREKLGEAILAHHEVVDHRLADVETVGQIEGIPVQVNRRLVAPGTLVIALGLVEPHQMAGYSGGAKTVVIGCGGAETIAATHGPRFLGHAGVQLGMVAGNPFQVFVRQAGRLIGLQWVYNAVVDHSGRIVSQLSGPADVVHDALVRQARQLYEQPVQAPYDVVLAGVGAPKDANLYQASRAATYIGLSARPVIRPGGVIILPAPLPEGAGQGAGEQNFIAALHRHPNLADLIAAMETRGCQPGEQRAYLIARLLRQYRVIVAGAEHPDVVKQAHLAPVESMEEAFALARVWCGARHTAPRLLIVPHALRTLPIPA